MPPIPICAVSYELIDGTDANNATDSDTIHVNWSTSYSKNFSLGDDANGVDSQNLHVGLYTKARLLVILRPLLILFCHLPLLSSTGIGRCYHAYRGY